MLFPPVYLGWKFLWPWSNASAEERPLHCTGPSRPTLLFRNLWIKKPEMVSAWLGRIVEYSKPEDLTLFLLFCHFHSPLKVTKFVVLLHLVSACPVQVKGSSFVQCHTPPPTLGTAHPSTGNPATTPGPLALPNTTQSFRRLWWWRRTMKHFPNLWRIWKSNSRPVTRLSSSSCQDPPDGEMSKSEVLPASVSRT